LTRCCADHDSGRGTEQRDFYPEDATFRRAPCPAKLTGGKPSPPIIRKLRGMGVSFQKPHRLTFHGMLMRPRSSILEPLKGFFLVASVVNICPGPSICGNGGVRLFNRSLNAIFEKRSPWTALTVGLCWWAMPFKRLGMTLFLTPGTGEL
jgi:hypothetical protein